MPAQEKDETEALHCTPPSLYRGNLDTCVQSPCCQKCSTALRFRQGVKIFSYVAHYGEVITLKRSGVGRFLEIFFCIIGSEVTSVFWKECEQPGGKTEA